MSCCQHYNVRCSIDNVLETLDVYIISKEVSFNIHIWKCLEATTVMFTVVFLSSYSSSWGWCCPWQIFSHISGKYLQCHAFLKAIKYLLTSSCDKNNTHTQTHTHTVAVIEKIAQCHLYLICILYSIDGKWCTVYTVFAEAQHSTFPHRRCCYVRSSWLGVAINCNGMASSNQIQLHCDFIQSVLSHFVFYFRLCVCVHFA